MKNSRKWRRVCTGTAAILFTAAGAVCLGMRVSQLGINPSVELAAAEMAMPADRACFQTAAVLNSGAFRNQEHEASETAKTSGEEKDTDNRQQVSGSSEVKKSSPEQKDTSKDKGAKKQDNRNENGFEASEATEEEINEYDREHEGEEKYPVEECHISEGNESYGNVQVRNSASTEIDIKSELESELGFAMEDTEEPQVLIYHTHTSESYLTYDTGYFYESFYPRSTDRSENVCAVGEEIKKQLEAAGIRTLHDTTLHDHPSYSGAYDRSLETIEGYLEKYPSIKVVLDIHRDGIGTDTEKQKPVFTAEGRQAAQVMVLAGYNYDDCDEFSDWEYNLRFALRIQKKAEDMYPGMMRPVHFSDFMYNMNVNTGSLLIEVGAESNTLEEARYSGFLLGRVLAGVLGEAKDETEGE